MLQNGQMRFWGIIILTLNEMFSGIKCDMDTPMISTERGSQ